VRELENLVYRSAVMAQSDTILIKDLPQEMVSAVGDAGLLTRSPFPAEAISNIEERAQSAGEVEVPHADPPSPQEVVGASFGNPFDAAYQQLRDEHGNNILEHAEREMIKRALEEASGKQVKAAEILGMTRATLRKRIDQYDLGK
jgi:two-component system nitrogen regulation response regulator GlnG